MKTVIDTNVLLVCISNRSKDNWLWQAILSGEVQICLTTDIISEYEEIIGRKMGQGIADLALDILTDLPNTLFINKYYSWQLIEADPDDNKFVDCAIAASARFLVSEDKHFRVLQQYPYLNTEVVNLQQFKKILDTET